MTISGSQRFDGPFSPSVACQATADLIGEGRTSDAVQARIEALMQEQKGLRKEKNQLSQEIIKTTNAIGDINKQIADEKSRIQNEESLHRKTVSEDKKKQARLEALKKTVDEQELRIASFCEESERRRYGAELERQETELLEKIEKLYVEIELINGPKTEELKRQIGRQKYINDKMGSDIDLIEQEIRGIEDSEVYKVHKQGRGEVSELMALGNEQILLKQSQIDGLTEELKTLILQRKEEFIQLLK